jgi:hypothetical protein
MPGYKGHLAGGLVVSGLGIYLLTSYAGAAFAGIAQSHITGVTATWATQAEWLLFGLAGSLFPDIDVKSRGQHYFYWFVLILLSWCALKRRYDMALGISIMAVIPMLARHRGLFHRAWFVIVMPLLVWLICSCYKPSMSNGLLIDSYFFIAGALSHLWLDMGLKRMLRVR